MQMHIFFHTETLTNEQIFIQQHLSTQKKTKVILVTEC